MTFELTEAIAILERTPNSLGALLEGLPESWVRATEGESTWSAFDVMGHLILGERHNWIPRAKHVLAGSPEAFASFDRTAMMTENENKNLSQLIKTFSELRQENIKTLQGFSLTQTDLNKQALHPELGVVKLQQLLATWVVHDLDHIVQISRTMAKNYANETGPWSAYLSVLRDRQK